MKISAVIASFVVGFSFSSMANTTAVWTHHAESFFLSEVTDFGGRVFYNCDSVESFTESLLEDMGAANVEVTCTGGLDEFPGYNLPASVEVEFDSLTSKVAPNTDPTKLVQAKLQSVQVTGWDDCLLAADVFEHVKSHFEIADLKERSSCSSAHSHYNYTFKALFPAN